MKKVAIPVYNYRGMMLDGAAKILRENGFDVELLESDKPVTEEQKLAMCKDAYGICCGPEKYSAELLKQCPNLKIIMKYGVGVDNIDLDACKELGITIGKCANNIPVAEHAVMLMLASLKQVKKFDRIIRNGGWDRANVFELTGKTVGIVGFGNIGRRVAEMIGGFNVKILAYDPYQNPAEAERLHATYVDFDYLIQNSDIITLHMPGTTDGTYLIGKKQFDMMKDNVVLINTARGSLINQNDLCEALDSGKIFSAGLDVFEKEPTGNSNPLFKYDNVIVTPHVASGTLETHTQMGVTCAEGIIAYAKGEKLQYPVL